MAIERPSERTGAVPMARRAFYVLFTIGATASIFIYLFSVVSPGEVYAVIKKISWPGVWMFVIFSIIMNIARTWRYMLIIQLSGFNPGGVVMYLVTLVRNLFADLLPARIGTLIYIYLINSRVGIPLGNQALTLYQRSASCMKAEFMSPYTSG